MKKRLLATILCLCMVVTLLPTVVFAADTGKVIQDGIGGISGYDSVKGTYDYIYYGTYDGNPIKWRVLDAQTNTGETGLFLLLPRQNGS